MLMVFANEVSSPDSHEGVISRAEGSVRSASRHSSAPKVPLPWGSEKAVV